MATKKADGLDPRFDPAFQRGGTGAAPSARASARASAEAPLTAPRLDDGVAVSGAPAGRERMPATRRAPLDADPAAADERHFEIVVAGNPWLRALWVVGGATTLVGFVLTFYAEFAFSVPPASGIYDPSVYIVPRLAEALALPLVIAGVVALVAATTLRLVAWRPSGATAVVGE
jgi:hypothetical protein